MNIFRIGLVLLGCVALPLAAAAEPGSIRLATVAEQEKVVTDESGAEVVTRLPAAKVVPGEEVIYTVTFENVGDQPVGNVTITNPVPQHMVYVVESALGLRTEVSYSVDGGSNWGAPEELSVPDAEQGERMARAEDYTHIRWVLNEDLQPGESGYVAFRAVLQ